MGNSVADLYTKGSQLGEGLQAKVFKYERKVDGDTFAVKLIEYENYISDKSRIKNFKQEIAVLK